MRTRYHMGLLLSGVQWLSLAGDSGLVAAATLPPATVNSAKNSDLIAGAPRTLLAQRDLEGALQRVRQLAPADRDAAYLLGMLLLNGVGTAPDPLQARQWLEQAANQDHAAAAFMMSWLTSRDPAAAADTASAWLARAVRLGDPRAVDAQRDPETLLHPVWAAGNDSAARGALALYAARHDDVALLNKTGPDAARSVDDFGQSALALAVDAGALRAIDWLLGNGADARHADQHGTTPLMRAASQAGSDALSRLLTLGTDVNAVDSERRTALMAAARMDRTDNLELLRAAGANSAARDSRDYNALDIALLSNATHAASMLRDWGLKPTVAHGPGARPGLFDAAHPGELYRDWPPAALATARDDVNTLRQLLDGGMALNLRTPQGDTLLHVAYHAGAGNALELLLSRGADSAAGDRRGRSVLGLATADAGRAEVLELLLKAHASADAHASGEAAPLLIAIRAGLVSTATRLVTAGASVNVRDDDGSTTLMAALLSPAPALLPLLLQHGASVNAVDARGRSATWVAASLGDLEQLRALLAAGGNADSADQDGMTPLAAASLGGKTDVVEALLRARASAAHADHHGDTPLHVAAAAGQVAVVQALLRAAPPLDAVNQSGDTALIAASRNGHTEVCRLLLSAGSRSALRNKNRQSAGDVARNRGFTALADLLDRKN